MHYYTENWDMTKQRFTALWHKEVIDRCCFAVEAPKNGADPVLFPPDNEYWYTLNSTLLALNPTNLPYVLAEKEKVFASTYYGGESFPQIWLNYGACGHAAYFGSAYKVTEETVWFEPVINNWHTDRLEFQKSHPLLKQQMEAARFFAEQGRGRFMVSTFDNTGVRTKTWTYKSGGSPCIPTRNE